MFRRSALALGGLLVLFHAWLLGSQLWEGALADPALLLRWLAAVGLVLALAGLRRRGASLIWGRQAVAIWLLAALLHGPSVVAGSQAHESPALPEAVTAFVQIAAASVALGLGLALLAVLLRRRPSRPFVLCRPVAPRRMGGFDPGRSFRFAPRPPPSLSLPAVV